jgi:hypothetical protein
MICRLVLSCILLLTVSILFMACSNTEKEKHSAGPDNAGPEQPAVTAADTPGPSAVAEKADSRLKQKQPIIASIYTADPSAHVFEGKIYIYPSHDPDYAEPVRSDDDGGQYMMEDYHVLSIDDFNSPCVDHGVALHLHDIPWAKQQLWAPDAAYKDGTYYLYFPAKDQENIFRMGVATSDNPAGLFTAEPDFIPGSFSIDPAVFVDDDGSAYMVFGGIWGGQLERWQTGTYEPEAAGPAGTEPAIGPRIAELSDDMRSFKDVPQEISIVDDKGKPILANDVTRRFFEGCWVHKYNGKYYLSYSTGTTHFIVYAVSDDIRGPYVFQGRILNPVKGWTTHHSIVQFQDKWYLFYHDATLSGGVDYERSVNYAELTYNEDGTIQIINPYGD